MNILLKGTVLFFVLLLSFCSKSSGDELPGDPGSNPIVDPSNPDDPNNPDNPGDDPNNPNNPDDPNGDVPSDQDGFLDGKTEEDPSFVQAHVHIEAWYDNSQTQDIKYNSPEWNKGIDMWGISKAPHGSQVNFAPSFLAQLQMDTSKNPTLAIFNSKGEKVSITTANYDNGGNSINLLGMTNAYGQTNTVYITFFKKGDSQEYYIILPRITLHLEDKAQSF